MLTGLTVAAGSDETGRSLELEGTDVDRAADDPRGNRSPLIPRRAPVLSPALMAGLPGRSAMVCGGTAVVLQGTEMGLIGVADVPTRSVAA